MAVPVESDGKALWGISQGGSLLWSDHMNLPGASARGQSAGPMQHFQPTPWTRWKVPPQGPCSPEMTTPRITQHAKVAMGRMLWRTGKLRTEIRFPAPPAGLPKSLLVEIYCIKIPDPIFASETIKPACQWRCVISGGRQP